MTVKKIDSYVESSSLDPNMRVAILSASSSIRQKLRDECEKLGLKECTDFTYAHELMPILKITTCHLLITAGDIGDMHWATFFRALRGDIKIPHTPALFIPSTLDSTFKEQSEILRPMHVGLLNHFNPVSPEFKGLEAAIQKVLNDEKNVGSHKAKLKEAKEFYRAGLTAQAQRVYRSLLNDKPDDQLAALGIVQTAGVGDKETLDQITQLISSDPSNYCYWFEILNYHMANKNFGKFAQAFEAVSADLRTASDSYWLYQLASICISLRQPKFALRCVRLLEANKTQNTDWIPYYIRTRIFLDQGNVDRAEQEIFLAAVHCKFESAEILNVIGIVQRRREQHSEALVSFAKATLATPLDYRIQYNLALAYLGVDQKGLAIQSLQRAIEIFPHYSRALSKLSEITGF